jgi:hypothetical protein
MMKPAAAIFFALIAASLALQGCIRLQPPEGAGGRYFEIVREGKSLGDLGSTEYLMTDGGMILRKIKVEYSGREPPPAEISLFRANEGEIKSIFNEVKSNAFTKYEECESCATFHLFYSDSQGTKAYGMPEEKSTDFVKGLPGRLEALIQNAQPQETYFLSFVYSKKGLIRDYHIFKDGAVIYEEFGTRPPVLLNAWMFKLEEGKALPPIPDGFFGSKTDGSCNRKGFEYGYVEAAEGNNYNFAFTCGNGTLPAEQLFDQLFALLEGRK